ncbi:MAG: GNAT family N-acetyltransferase [Clostridiales bacterium]|jgi:GNAT superfamily N-acetyltransferase|nr:GNAT family N-acetyltransferase [Clostridiales bacterium]
MADLIAKLYELEKYDREFKDDGVVIKRAHITDKQTILQFVKDNFTQSWANECEYAMFNSPPSCFIAVKEKQVVGFACYDACAKGFFGPTGVMESERLKGIGTRLLMKSLYAMREMGYGYAIIGWTSDARAFYEKKVDAAAIIDSPPNKSIYKNMISQD